MKTLVLYAAAWSIATLIYLALFVIGLAVLSTIGHFFGVGAMLVFGVLAAVFLSRAPR